MMEQSIIEALGRAKSRGILPTERRPKIGDRLLAYRPLRLTGSLAPHPAEWSGARLCEVVALTEVGGAAPYAVALVAINPDTETPEPLGASEDFVVFNHADIDETKASSVGLNQWAQWASDPGAK